jgi:hypothetical protein
MSLLWTFSVSDTNYRMCKELLKKSTHRFDERRIKHLANWIFKSPNKDVALNFIYDNLDSKNFYPFANPWEGGEINKIFEKTQSTKLIRLSTRDAGKLTISNINGLSESRRIVIESGGIKFGNYTFKDITDLVAHIDESECCICLENITINISIVLKCGHIFHMKCLELQSCHSNSCPFCKTELKRSFTIPQGEISIYEIIDPVMYDMMSPEIYEIFQK